jgi:hypothetical protein
VTPPEGWPWPAPLALAIGLAHVMPWWAAAPIAALGPLGHIYRQYLRYRLARQALAKARPADIPAIMTAIAPAPREPWRPAARQRPRIPA